MMSPKKTDQKVRDISVAIYKMRLGERDTARMLAKDADGGAKLRERAKAYDILTRCYMKVLKTEPK